MTTRTELLASLLRELDRCERQIADLARANKACAVTTRVQIEYTRAQIAETRAEHAVQPSPRPRPIGRAAAGPYRAAGRKFPRGRTPRIVIL